MSQPQPSAWVWDPRTGNYRDLATGRFLLRDQVVNLVDTLVDRANEQGAGTLATMLSDGRLNTADWQAGMARLIKNTYIQQTELAAGGRANVTREMWGSVGGQVAEQYRYLRDFAREVESGSLTAAQIRARSEMYISSSREAFWRVKDRQARAQGFTEERWVPIGDDSTCGPCSDAGAMGWQPIGTFAQPGSGRVRNSPETSCQGLTRCRCQKEYR
jgi:hypothetical protein